MAISIFVEYHNRSILQQQRHNLGATTTANSGTCTLHLWNPTMNIGEPVEVIEVIEVDTTQPSEAPHEVVPAVAPEPELVPA